MAEFGPRWGRDGVNNVHLMVDAFTPLLAHAPKAGVEVVRDLSYGDDERQQLDVYTPGRAGSRPVVLFVHGGAFTGGERNRSPEIYRSEEHKSELQSLIRISYAVFCLNNKNQK